MEIVVFLMENVFTLHKMDVQRPKVVSIMGNVILMGNHAFSLYKDVWNHDWIVSHMENVVLMENPVLQLPWVVKKVKIAKNLAYVVMKPVGVCQQKKAANEPKIVKKQELVVTIPSKEFV